MPLSSEDWADAFAKEARSDWKIYLLLSQQTPPVEACHWLHYLQMATEKAGKSYQMRAASNPENLAKSHIAFWNGLSVFIQGPGAHLMAHLKGSAWDGQFRKYRRLAQAVEQLAPANSPTKTPDNVEYPWPGRDRNGKDCLKVPCRYTFTIEAQLKRDPGFLKIVSEFVSRA